MMMMMMMVMMMMMMMMMMIVDDDIGDDDDDDDDAVGDDVGEDVGDVDFPNLCKRFAVCDFGISVRILSWNFEISLSKTAFGGIC